MERIDIKWSSSPPPIVAPWRRPCPSLVSQQFELSAPNRERTSSRPGFAVIGSFEPRAAGGGTVPPSARGRGTQTCKQLATRAA